MKKVIGVLAIAIVVTGVVSGFLVYQLSVMQSQNSELKNQISELENQINKVTNLVTISEFSISGFKPVEGFVIFESNVYVKICNLGINDIEGVALVIVGFGDESLAETLQIETLYIGEELEINNHAYWTHGSAGTSIASLKLDDIILNEYFLTFSEVYS